MSPWWGGAALWASFNAAPADAQQAGSSVVNIATAELSGDAGVARIASNAAALRLDELLDIALASGAPSAALPIGVAGAVPFTLTNRGNGQEAFALSGALTDADGTIDGIAIDTDGNGAFDPAIDRLLGRGEVSTDPLSPGASLALLMLMTPTRIGAGARVAITGRALTGSGQPGSVLAGRGDGGSDAVVGTTTAAARLDLPLASAAGDEATASLIKSQTVLAPDGSQRPTRGAVITYTLAATFRGTGTAAAASVSDPIPARTGYVAGSLTLDGVGLSDADDGDAGRADGSAVRVELGSVTAPATHTIRFQVTIQ